ncbi:MAG TPA: hypothetical protein DEB39_14310 [Planctomycetaceae bacterium]|nr:hypothetical protein [Planctomycetaceae bacterium]
MAVFNRNFFDLNHERGYCVDGAAGLPPDMISDLKVSVPNRTESIRMANVFSQDESVRIVFVAALDSREQAVAHFSSDARSMIRIGMPYPLTSLAEGYGGLIVFGEGIRNDVRLTTPLTISEECLTRFEPSAVPYVSLTCDSVRLTGEVRLSGGDPDRLISDGVDVPEELLGCVRALRLALVDPGSDDSPMIALANGIDTYAAREDRGGPIYKLFGAMPDASGRITIRWDEHFHFLAAGAPQNMPSTLALGTDRTTDEICRAINGTEENGGAEPRNSCPPSSIEFERIEYE